MESFFSKKLNKVINQDWLWKYVSKSQKNLSAIDHRIMKGKELRDLYDEKWSYNFFLRLEEAVSSNPII